MAQTVIGFFDDQQEAQRAVEKLQAEGISRDRVDVSRGGATHTSMPGSSDVNSVSGSERDENSMQRTADDRTVDREGRNTNAFTDFFNNLFGGGDDSDKADRYSRVAERSNSIVTVHARSREEAERAADILDDCGAIDVDERAAAAGSVSSSSTDKAQRANLSGEHAAAIPRVEENLHVGKRTEETGGVRVRSRIVERPVEEHVRLREEHVHVERQPVDRPLSMDDARAFQERDIELRESREVPVVDKEARVVEEIRLSKDVTEREETIRDTVRNTDVDVDRIDAGTTQRTDRDNDSDLDDRNRSERGGLL
jgi:stress response protein YsnF